MKLLKSTVALLLVVLSLSPLTAQKTAVFTDANRFYKRGIAFYDQAIYPQAKSEFEKAVSLLQPINEPTSDLLMTKAKLQAAKCAVRLNHPDGEKLVLDYARELDPDPAAAEAILEIGNYYFDNGDYHKAVDLLSRVNMGNLNKSQRAEIQFKYGYSLFVRKQFEEALNVFAKIKDIQGEYYMASNYYYGMTLFFAENYDQATRAFQKVSQDERYGPYIPYYITQIYFAQGRYDEVIDYGKQKTKNRSYRKLAEINQLVGQAYFEKGEFTTAEPYLSFYAENGRNQRPEDFYQLAFVQYKSGKYADAAKNFEQLGQSDNAIGQNAMYLLGDCQIKLSDKEAARNAFRTASRLNYDEKTKMESLYNYAKLSYDLNYDREAVTALESIPIDSPYYRDAQAMLGELFLNTRDYAKAIETLEKMPNKTAELKKTYQIVLYNRGVQLMQKGKASVAKTYFDKSLVEPFDLRTKALAYFWLGDIAHREKNYSTSITRLNQFLGQAKTLSRLPDEASEYTANYTQGYNYIRSKDFTNALKYFKAAEAGIKKDAAFIDNQTINQEILGDATLRAGDCLFKKNKYREAVQYYDKAITYQYSGFTYAIYQKGIIEGLQGNPTNKLIELEKIVDNYPNSEYADKSLLAMGSTYLEIGKPELAEQSLKKLVSNYRNSELNNAALLKLGLIAYNAGNQSQAIDYYKRIFANNPEARDAQSALTALEEIYVDDLGRPQEYFSFLETIPGYDIKEDEKEAINFKTAEVQYENGNYEKATELFTRYLNKYPNSRNSMVARYHRAESYTIVKNYRAAFEDYQWIINKGQSKYYAKSLRNAALIAYNDSKDFQMAYEYYSLLETVAEDEGDRFEAKLGALRSAYRSGNKAAVKSLSESVIEHPKASQEQRAAAYFYQGKIDFDLKNLVRAKAALEQVTALTNNESAAEARYLIAYIHYLDRDLEQAQEMCLAANKQSSNYPYWVAKSIILLADVFAERGNYFNAQAALETLIDNYTEDQALVNEAKSKLVALQNKTATSNRILKPDEVDESELEIDNEENQN